MKRIFLILGLLIIVLNNYGQEGKNTYLDVTKELTVRDTTIIDLINTHSSGSLIDGANGLSKSGSNIELGGSTLTKDVEIPGSGYIVNIGTGASNIGTFELNSNDEVYFNASNPIYYTSDGKQWVFNGDNWINLTTNDTLQTGADVTAKINASLPYVPFNFSYNYSTTITDSRPGVGFFRLDNATYTNVTKIFIDNFDSESVDKSDFIELPDTGSYISITDGTSYINYQITGAVTVASSYYKYEVTYLNHSGVISGLCDISLDLNNDVGGGGGLVDKLANATDTIQLVSDTLDMAEQVLDARKVLSDTISTNIVQTPYITDNGGGALSLESTNIDISAGDYAQIASGNTLEIGANTNVSYSSNTSTILHENDTVFMDGTGISTPVNLKAKYVESGEILADSLSIGGGDVLTSSDTIDLKTAIENTELDKIQFDTAFPSYSEGALFYDKNENALSFYNDISGFKEELGRGINVKFYNNSGGTLTDGTLIRSTGAKANGSINFIGDIAGNGSLDSLQGIAMVTADVLNGQFGMATLVGQVNGLNTSAYVDNQLLWVGSGGTYIDTIPEAPNYASLFGRVVYADADSGAIYMFPVGESRYMPIPNISASFTRQTATITNPGLNVPALITNGTNNLYTVDYNVGFQEVGDSIAPLQSGVYNISYSDAFQGDAATGDEWRIGIFINAVEIHTVLRTSSSSNKGVVASGKIVELSPTDWVTLKIINTTNATRSSIFTDGVINIEYISAQ